MTLGTLYNYLAEGVGVTPGDRAVIPGGGAGGAVAPPPPSFGQQHFLGFFHTPLTERYHQKWC